MTTSMFKITPTPPTSIRLEPDQEGRLSFTVESLAAPDQIHEIMVQALLVDGGGTGQEVGWLAVEPRRTLPMAGGKTETVVVTARPTSTSPRGEHRIKLVIADRDRPNDVYSESPPVTCEVSVPVERPRPPKKRSWWWIPAIAGGLLVVGAGVVVAWKLAGDGDDAGSSRGPISIEIRPVTRGAAIPDGRLVVAFFQLNDDLRPRPRFHIGYDVPFAGSTRTIELPLDEVELPVRIDDYRLCARTCEDLTSPLCRCLAAEPKVALAMVVIARDANNSGAIEPEELERFQDLIGVGYFMLGAADKVYLAPNRFDSLFLDGIVDGLAPYRVVPPPRGSPFDRLRTPAPGTVFELDVCVPRDASCKLRRIPNLT